MKQRVMNARAQLGLSFLFSSGSPAKEWSCHIQHRFSHFINPVYELPHRHPHRFVSKVILDLSDCWTVESLSGLLVMIHLGEILRTWPHNRLSSHRRRRRATASPCEDTVQARRQASLLTTTWPCCKADLRPLSSKTRNVCCFGHFVLIWKHVLLNTSSQIPETEPEHSREGQWAFK